MAWYEPFLRNKFKFIDMFLSLRTEPDAGFRFQPLQFMSSVLILSFKFIKEYFYTLHSCILNKTIPGY